MKQGEIRRSPNHNLPAQMNAALRGKSRIAGPMLFCLWLPLAATAGEVKPVDYYREVVPILKRSCTGCHHPGKLKGELDLTTFAAFQKGGKHGAGFTPGNPAASRVIDEVNGEEPSMPKEGDPLSKTELTLLQRWIQEGAKDDTPEGAGSF